MPQTNPNSLANLQVWQKGESGNPKGRPKGQHLIQQAFKEQLNKVISKKGKFAGLTFAQIMAKKSVAMILKAETIREFSMLCSEFRLAAGEVPRQEVEIDLNERYAALSFAQLMLQVKQLVDGYQAPIIDGQVLNPQELNKEATPSSGKVVDTTAQIADADVVE